MHEDKSECPVCHQIQRTSSCDTKKRTRPDLKESLDCGSERQCIGQLVKATSHPSLAFKGFLDVGLIGPTCSVDDKEFFRFLSSPSNGHLRFTYYLNPLQKLKRNNNNYY